MLEHMVWAAPQLFSPLTSLTLLSYNRALVLRNSNEETNINMGSEPQIPIEEDMFSTGTS